MYVSSAESFCLQIMVRQVVGIAGDMVTWFVTQLPQMRERGGGAVVGDLPHINKLCGDPAIKNIYSSDKWSTRYSLTY